MPHIPCDFFIRNILGFCQVFENCKANFTSVQRQQLNNMLFLLPGKTWAGGSMWCQTGFV